MKRWHIALMIVVVVAGVTLAIWMAARGSRETTPAQAVANPVPHSYNDAISGSGIVEAGPEESYIGSSVSGVVRSVYVSVGDLVEIGEPLFKLDDRDAKAQVQLARTELEVSKKRVNEAKQELADREDQYARVANISDKRAVSIDEVNKRRFARQIAEAKLDTSMAEEMRARARLKVTETDLSLLTAHSPIKGRVLQVNIDPGEYAVAGEMNEPLILLGGEGHEVKVDIDENDAWRFNSKGAAIATLKGNPSIQFPLTFVSVEPFVVPKKSLTRDTRERVDTRVLQVHYTFDRGDLPVYIGQQVDVTIEVPDEG